MLIVLCIDMRLAFVETFCDIPLSMYCSVNVKNSVKNKHRKTETETETIKSDTFFYHGKQGINM